MVYATEQGLGVLAKAFYDHQIITDVAALRHPSYANLNTAWYPNSLFIENLRNGRELRKLTDFCLSMDALLFFETPFAWEIIPKAREAKIKTVLMPMYECTPKPCPYEPDYYFCPSLLDLKYYPDRSKFIPVPVEMPWKQRDKARVFVHNAGRGGLNQRNGTGVLLDAIKYVKSPIKLIIRSQKPLQWTTEDPRVEIRIGSISQEALYADGDVFIFPEKFNGLSLPLQEAAAAGMLVMAGDRFPMNTWLPTDPLIPVLRYEKERIAGRCPEYDAAIYDPTDIAKTIDAWYDKDIREYSAHGKYYSQINSWRTLGPRYLRYLKDIKGAG